MKKLSFVALALSIAAPAAAADGAAVFGSRCTVCHGQDGKGSPAGLKLGAKDLTKVKDSQAEIEAVVTNGKGKMTAFKGKLSPEQIAAVAKFVKGGLK